MKHLLIFSFVLALCVAPVVAQQESAPSQPSAQDVAALVQQIKDLQERVISLEGKVRTLQSTQATPTAASPETTQPATAPQSTETAGTATPTNGPEPSYGGAGGSAAKALNPDISVIGDFIGAAGRTDVPALASQQAFPSLQMHESEIGLQAIIDPYARGDFFISFGEEGVNLEEGYITFTALPKGFVAKVGKMRSVFG